MYLKRQWGILGKLQKTEFWELSPLEAGYPRRISRRDLTRFDPSFSFLLKMFSKRQQGTLKNCQKTKFWSWVLLRPCSRPWSREKISWHFHPWFLEVSKNVCQKTTEHPSKILQNRVLGVEATWGLVRGHGPEKRSHDFSPLAPSVSKWYLKRPWVILGILENKFLELSDLEAYYQGRISRRDLMRFQLSFLSFFLKMLSKGQQGTLRKFKKTKFLELSPLEALFEAMVSRKDLMTFHPWFLEFLLKYLRRQRD